MGEAVSRFLHIGALDLTPYINQTAWAAQTVFPMLKAPLDFEKDLWLILNANRNPLLRMELNVISNNIKFRVRGCFYTELGSGITLAGEGKFSIYLYRQYGNFWTEGAKP